MTTAVLLLELSLVFSFYLAWRQIILNSRFVLWRRLLEKYPPRPDQCVTILNDAVDCFVLENILLGGSNTRIPGCPIVIGERGLHLVNGEDPRCHAGGPVKQNHAFIPWSRLQPQGDPRCLEVLGTGDRLLVRYSWDQLLAFNPLANLSQEKVDGFAFAYPFNRIPPVPARQPSMTKGVLGSELPLQNRKGLMAFARHGS